MGAAIVVRITTPTPPSITSPGPNEGRNRAMTVLRAKAHRFPV